MEGYWGFILGNAEAGKTTMARDLMGDSNILCLSLDAIAWTPDIDKKTLQMAEFVILEGVCESKSKMLEIRQHYVLNDDGELIAVQIPIAQFEALLKLVNDPDRVRLLSDDGSWTVEELQQAAKVGMMALEADQYTDYDMDGLQNLFDGIKQNGRYQRGIEA